MCIGLGWLLLPELGAIWGWPILDGIGSLWEFREWFHLLVSIVALVEPSIQERCLGKEKIKAGVDKVLLARPAA